MRIKKTAVFVFFILLCVVKGITASATSYDKAAFELQGLKVITTEQAEKNPNEQVTRGEFADIITKLINLGDMSDNYSYRGLYSDVSSDYEYSRAVEALTDLKILCGSDGRFSPDAPVTYLQAVKVLCVCTGYGEQAAKEGGWPRGYLSIAGKKGFLKGVNASEEINRENLYIMIYNSLDAELLTQVAKMSGTEYEINGDTLRSVLMGNNLYKSKDIFYADAFSYASYPIDDLKDNEVVIGDVILENNFADSYNLLGREVEYFAEGIDGKYVLLSIMPTAKNNVTEIFGDESPEKAGNTITYNGGKEKKVKLSDKIRVVYNGTRIISYTDDIFSIKNGKITAVDNNGDNAADCVIIDEAVNAVATKFDGVKLVFSDICTFNGLNTLSVDTNKDEKKKMVVTDSDGSIVESFEGEKVVSIFEDKYQTRYRVIVNDEVVEKYITGKDEDYVYSNDEQYKTDKNNPADVVLGTENILYLTYDGTIAYAKAEEKVIYGYVKALGKRNGLSTTEARIILSGQVDFGVDTNDEDVNDTSKVPFLISKNGDEAVYKLAKRVKYNDSAMDSEALAGVLSSGSVIGFKLNSDGEISKITTPKYVGGSDTGRLYYNVYEMTFGGVEYTSPFAIDNNTRVICIPNNADEDDDYFVTVKIDETNNSVGYIVSGYEINEDTKTVDLLVVHADMDSSQVRDVLLTSSKASIVTSVKNLCNTEDGTERKVVKLLNAEAEKELELAEVKDKNNQLGNLKRGDLIAYLENTNGEMENVLKFRSFSGNMDDIRTSFNIGYTETLGTAGQYVRNEIDSIKNVKITKLDVISDGYTYTFDVPQRNKPPVYLMDTADGNAFSSAELTDIIPGIDRVYVLCRTSDAHIRAIVIIR